MKFGGDFGVKFGGDFGVKFGVCFILVDSWSQWVVPLIDWKVMKLFQASYSGFSGQTLMKKMIPNFTPNFTSNSTPRSPPNFTSLHSKAPL